MTDTNRTDSAESTGSRVQQSTGQRGAETERAIGVSREGAAPSAATRPRSDTRSMSASRNAGMRNTTPLLPTLMSNPGLMASAFLSNPYGFARAMNQEFDRLFGLENDSISPFDPAYASTDRDRPQSDERGLMSPSSMRSFVPALEVKQLEDEMIICADLPGMNPEDVHVDLDDGMLTISGERRNNREENQEGFYRSERSYGAFTRSIAVPEGVDENKVKASFDNGVLEVTIPIPETQRQRRRRIQVNPRSSSGSSPREQAESRTPTR